MLIRRQESTDTSQVISPAASAQPYSAGHHPPPAAIPLLGCITTEPPQVLCCGWLWLPTSKVTFEMRAVMSVSAWPELRRFKVGYFGKRLPTMRDHGIPVRAPAEGQETRLR